MIRFVVGDGGRQGALALMREQGHWRVSEPEPLLNALAVLDR